MRVRTVLGSSDGHTRMLSRVVSVIALVGSSLGLSGCSSTSQNVIGSSQWVGTWRGVEGQLAFKADHSLTVTALRLDSNTRFLTHCPSAWSGFGSWEFLSPQGTGGTDLTQYRADGSSPSFFRYVAVALTL